MHNVILITLSLSDIKYLEVTYNILDDRKTCINLLNRGFIVNFTIYNCKFILFTFSASIR